MAEELVADEPAHVRQVLQLDPVVVVADVEPAPMSRELALGELGELPQFVPQATRAPRAPFAVAEVQILDSFAAVPE